MESIRKYNLGRKEFVKYFKQPIEDGQDRNADEKTRLFGEEMAQKLHSNKP